VLRSLASTVVAALLAACITVGVPAQAQVAHAQVARAKAAPFVFTSSIEAYAGYQPQTTCRRFVRPGVRTLAASLVARGGGMGPIGGSCSGSGTSEHKEARAFDWMLDVEDPADQLLGSEFLDEVFAPDELGNPHALARRMGIMYVIWNDRIWSSYHGFVERPYLSSSCAKRRTCSPTLRHRDHMHISLTRRAARGLTSWYVEQA
jgi:hypothetical protein